MGRRIVLSLMAVIDEDDAHEIVSGVIGRSYAVSYSTKPEDGIVMIEMGGVR